MRWQCGCMTRTASFPSAVRSRPALCRWRPHSQQIGSVSQRQRSRFGPTAASMPSWNAGRQRRRTETDRAVTVQQVGDLLRVPGVAGVWRFGRVRGADHRSEEREIPAARGSVRTLDASVTLAYLDDDPVSVSEPIRELLMPRWESERIAPEIAGPFEAITPWRWDWFEDQESRAAIQGDA